jgi:putative SOS response-associated peptidase YedK
MCGRFTLTADPEQIQIAFPGLTIPTQTINPRYNIAPTQPIAVIPNDGKSRLDYYIWGLIPSWAKDPSIGSRMINARAETLAEKPSFRNAFRRRRCLVLADGFYEWQQLAGKKSKQPMYIHMKNRGVFAFGGLWEIWNAPDGSTVLSATIITTEPNELVRPIHNRMPLILSEDHYDLWLSPDERKSEELQPALHPFPPDEMAAYAVTTQVNSPSNDEPALIEPI